MTAKKIAFIIVISFCLLCFLCSCSSVKKVSGSLKFKAITSNTAVTDSNTVHKKDSTATTGISTTKITVTDSSHTKTNIDTSSQTITVNLVKDTGKNVPANDYEAAEKVYDVTIDGRYQKYLIVQHWYCYWRCYRLFLQWWHQ